MVTPTVTTKVNNSNYDVSADQWNALIAATNASIAATKNQPYSYIIYKSGSTYYARNGATGAVDYSEAALADALTEAFTALTADGGVIFLSQLAFPMTSFASIPEGVRVVCDYNAEYWEYINSADSSGSPYTVSVGSGVNNGYYLAQDGEGRICKTSTSSSTLIAVVISVMSANNVLRLQGNIVLDDTITVNKSIVLEFDSITLGASMTTDAIDISSTYRCRVTGKIITVTNAAWDAVAVNVLNSFENTIDIMGVHGLGKGVGVQLSSSTIGVYLNTITAKIFTFDINMRFLTSESGWVNANRVTDTELYAATTTNLELYNKYSMSNNVFMNVETQTGSGLKPLTDIYIHSDSGSVVGTTFTNYLPYDFGVGQLYYKADENTHSTSFIGGFTNLWYSQDYGANTIFVGTKNNGNMLIEGTPITVPTSGWTETVTNNGTILQSPTFLRVLAAAQANSTALAYTPLYLTTNTQVVQGVAVDCFRFELKFRVFMQYDNTGQPNIGYIQIKEANTIGDLAADGFGLKIVGNSVYGQSFKSGLETTDLLGTFVNSRAYDVRIEVRNHVTSGTAIILFYINNVFVGSITGEDVPSNISNAYLVVSIDNQEKTSVTNLVLSGIQTKNSW